uniref:PAS domain-containing protein n=1 Tax=Acrobeloides nanus TaxID=290746 RepID=A0A914C4E6_9BILA
MLLLVEMARNRRDQEKNEVAELSHLLPLSPAIKDQLDRVSVIKMSTAFFALQNLIHGDESNCDEVPNFNGVFKSIRGKKNPYEAEPVEGFTLNTLQSMSGFTLVLDVNGKIIYVSETAAVNLGIAQVEMIGTSIFDLLHIGDVPSIQFALAIGYDQQQITIDNPEIRFTSRWRCSLTKRNAGITTCGYKTIHFVGRILSENGCRFIGYGEPLVGIFQLLGYGPGNLLDKSFYHLVHAEDCEFVRDAHRIVLEKNQANTECYRLLSHSGGICWVETKFIIVQVLRAQLSQCIVGITSVLGAQGNEVVDTIQRTTVSETNHLVLGEYSQNFYVPFALKDDQEENI